MKRRRGLGLKINITSKGGSMWVKQNIQGLNCWQCCSDMDSTFSIVSPEKAVELCNTFKEEVSLIDRPTNTHNEVFISTNSKKPKKKNILPSGIYRQTEINYTSYLVEEQLSIKTEVLEFDINKEITKDFEVFKKSEKIYKELDMLHKRGVLLYGPPGTGKTSIINKIVKTIASKDTIILFLGEDILDLSAIQEFRKDKRLKVIIFEEFTNHCDGRNEVSGKMLDFLDGETSLDNCFIVASTNYPELLPKNVTDRPGRFDKFYLLDKPSKEDVQKYFTSFKIKVDDSIVEKLHGKTIAELKEIVLLHKRDDRTLENAIECFNKQKDLINVKFETEHRVGFVL